jgi:hypothetical protein
MIRALLMTAAVACASLACAACDRPSEKKCQEAVDNIQKITKTDEHAIGPDPRAAVRSCQANASKDAVECMIAAQTLEELVKCEGDFAKEMAKDSVPQPELDPTPEPEQPEPTEPAEPDTPGGDAAAPAAGDTATPAGDTAAPAAGDPAKPPGADTP